LSAGNVRTPDLGGNGTTSEMCRAIREALLRRIESKGTEG